MFEDLKPIRIKLPPVTLVMQPFFLTWANWKGRLKCWWKDSHDFVKQDDEKDESSSYDCSRCGTQVWVIYERHYEARITGSTYQEISMAYTIKGDDIL